MKRLVLLASPTFIRQGHGKTVTTHAHHQAIAWGAKTLLIQSNPNTEAFYLAIGADQIDQKESEHIPGRFLPLLKLDRLSV